MAANTISLGNLLFEMANHVNEIQGDVITTYTSSTSFVCAGVAETTPNAFRGGLIREVGGVLIGTIIAFNGTTKEFTLFGSGVANLQLGDRVEWCFWDGNKYNAAVKAYNDAIRSQEDVWFQEVKQAAADSTITLDSQTFAYALPTDVHKLIKIGVYVAASMEPQWLDPMDIWEVIGQEGAFTLQFLPNMGGGTVAAWDSRVHYPVISGGGTLAQFYANRPLLLWYEKKESALVSLTDTTQMPLDSLVWKASDLYLQSRLPSIGPDEARNLNIALPQIQANAIAARSRLKRVKQTQITVKYEF